MDSFSGKWSAGVYDSFLFRGRSTGMLFIPCGMVTAIADEYAAPEDMREDPGAGGGAGEAV